MLICFRGPAEYAPIDETFNPAVHRVNHAVKMRAVHTERPIPEMPSVLLRFSSPPEDLIEKVQSRIDALVEAAEVKKVPPKAKGRRHREAVKPISGLDVDALLGEEKKGRVSEENAVPDFKRALASTEEISEIEDAVKQMGAIIRSLVTDSFGDSKYSQALECVGVMREELVNLEEPGVYNSFVRDLKKGLLSGALGGDRRDFWFKVRWSRLGLVEQEQSESSNVTLEEAEEVRTPTMWPDHLLTWRAVLQVKVARSCSVPTLCLPHIQAACTMSIEGLESTSKERVRTL